MTPITLGEYFLEKLGNRHSSVSVLANILKELETESCKLQEDINSLAVNGVADQIKKDTLYWIQKTYDQYEFNKIKSMILRSIHFKAAEIENRYANGLEVSDKDIAFAKLVRSMNINSIEQLVNVLETIAGHCGKSMTIPIKKYFRYSTEFKEFQAR